MMTLICSRDLLLVTMVRLKDPRDCHSGIRMFNLATDYTGDSLDVGYTTWLVQDPSYSFAQLRSTLLLTLGSDPLSQYVSSADSLTLESAFGVGLSPQGDPVRNPLRKIPSRPDIITIRRGLSRRFATTRPQGGWFVLRNGRG